VAVFPPHSTHSLQPLDVVCFSPLAASYSKELSAHIFETQGLVPITKGDFLLVLLGRLDQHYDGEAYSEVL
jgi:hypothetical protein